MASIVSDVRSVVGYEIPLSSDHYGHFDLNNAIRFGKKVEPYRLAWLEDMVAWQFTDQLKTISDALETPVLTGEDIYLLNGFKPLIDIHAVDIVHPDLATAGRPFGNQAHWGLCGRTWGSDGHAFCRKPCFLYGQRPLCGGNTKFPRPGTPLAG